MVLSGILRGIKRDNLQFPSHSGLFTAGQNVESIIQNFDDINDIVHSPTVLKHIAFLKNLIGVGIPEESRSFARIFKQIINFVRISDLICVFAIIVLTKPVLFQLFRLTEFISDRKRKADHKKYREESIFGYLEEPFVYLSWFPPFLYLIDIASVFMHGLGFNFHLKGNVPHALCTLGYYYIGGSFLTRLKDWYLQQVFRRKSGFTRPGTSLSIDPIRSKTIDDVSSIALWLAFFVSYLQNISLEFGFALGSIFALGGIGSASIILALRSTMENFVGGLLLKVQDKFRLGDCVGRRDMGAEGVVMDINYFFTTIRKNDNSIVEIPNHEFTKGDVVNWSRTPYRLYKTSVSVQMTEIDKLRNLLGSIRASLESLDGIELESRDLIVSAVGFNGEKVVINVEAHIKAQDDVTLAELQTEIVDIISSSIKSSV